MLVVASENKPTNFSFYKVQKTKITDKIQLKMISLSSFFNASL